MSSVFISYVREDERVVKFLVKLLELNGVSVWLDKDSLVPGQRWKPAIETAIRNGTYFLSVYSKARQSRDVSYANEETVVAIEEIRKRPVSRQFFIPLRIDDCEIEARSIGGGETILDLQICDLRNWSEGLISLFKALGVREPVTDLGVPLADGIPSFVKIQSGHITYDHMDTLPSHFQGMRFGVDTGWCTRSEDGAIIAYLEVVAPFAKFQAINRTLGLSGMHAVCHDEKISQEVEKPSVFSFERRVTIPAGATMLDLVSGNEVILPVPVSFDSDFTAVGHIDGLNFSGSFTAYLEPQPGMRINMAGHFDLLFEPDLKAKPKSSVDI